ncbi:hypothetical protein BHAOGJBA_4236 [Methylobacterium hispanicum]|uniref:Uncharacterized protein n=1 Tax=Methylobacterium hispanicum TaxID=270350 RepID=A0AAV4ZQ87_9HYPH|nr:hypothetical protein [Methylobacterium hispanicum]GJD90694.1 hypothetical protein BHAOGJBA_4236 [Methylobacterium hispanicum]
MSRERLTIPLVYVGDVVPRGARNPREACFRIETAVEIRTVSASDLAVAIDVLGQQSEPGLRQRYIGFEGSLWLPVEASVGVPLEQAQAIDSITSGACNLGNKPNPFLRIGRALRAESFPDARPIEEMPIRQVRETDLDDRLARASRVAADLLLVEGNRVLRRSPGPFWRCGPNARPFLVHPGFDLPGRSPDLVAGGAAYFGISRFEEMREFAAEEWGTSPAPDSCEILMHECVPDQDALVAARAVANFNAIQWMHMVAGSQPGAAADIPSTFRAAGALYGRNSDELSRGIGTYPACPGMQTPPPGEIIAAAEGMRDFFAAPIETDKAAVRAVHEANRKLFEQSAAPHLRRFDLYERGRLLVDDIAPDLDSLFPETKP